MSSCFFMSTNPLLPEVYIIILSHVTTLSAYFASSGAEKWFLDRSFRIVFDICGGARPTATDGEHRSVIAGIVRGRPVFCDG